MKREDLSGQRFGNLTALNVGLTTKKETKWLCRCSCGKLLEVYTKALKRGMTRSCGHTKERHGASDSIEYATFRRMKSRCENPNNHDFRLYGGRGIKVLFRSFAAFFEELGRRPSNKHSVDRIDYNGHYAAGNVRWATAEEQANNMRPNRLIEWDNRCLTLSQWGRETGLGRQVIEKRIDTLGWDIERALLTPKHH